MSTNEIFITITTQEFTSAAETQVKNKIQSILNEAGIHSVEFGRFSPYWKIAEHGTLTCHIHTNIPLSDIQCLFADLWKSCTADIRWSTIYLPGVSFLWISD